MISVATTPWVARAEREIPQIGREDWCHLFPVRDFAIRLLPYKAPGFVNCAIDFQGEQYCSDKLFVA
jgi:hypothetical protein